MKMIFGIALFFSLSCQARQEQQSRPPGQTAEVTISNDPKTFFASSDTLWLQVCDTTTEHLFFKKLKIGNGEQWFAGLFVDTITASLWQQKEGKWQLIDTISVGMPFFGTRRCALELPRLEVVDFNEDGHEDLKIPQMMNINGNVWSAIYLYDTIQHTLRRLKGAEDEPNLTYNRKTGILRSDKGSGVYGVSWVAFYRLSDNRAYPLKKAEQDNTGINMFGKGALLRLYQGNGTDWKLIKQVAPNEKTEKKF